METLPLEMLNMICKYLDWRDVKNFEEAFPRISFSGAKLDVVKISFDKLTNKKNEIARELQTVQCDLQDSLVDHFYILLNVHYFMPHDFVHSQEMIVILENQVMDKNKEKLEIEEEIKEICNWWEKVYLH